MSRVSNIPLFLKWVPIDQVTEDFLNNKYATEITTPKLSVAQVKSKSEIFSHDINSSSFVIRTQGNIQIIIRTTGQRDMEDIKNGSLLKDTPCMYCRHVMPAGYVPVYVPFKHEQTILSKAELVEPAHIFYCAEPNCDFGCADTLLATSTDYDKNCRTLLHFMHRLQYPDQVGITPAGNFRLLEENGGSTSYETFKEAQKNQQIFRKVPGVVIASIKHMYMQT